MTKNRLEAFSDGFFAIIMTIMVLDLQIPTTGDWRELTTAEFINVITSYVISFALVLSFSISHYFIFLNISKVNTLVMWANGLALLPMSLIPFVTSWHSKFPDKVAPSVIYNLIYAFSVFGLYLLASLIGRYTSGRLKKYYYVNNRTRIYLVALGLFGAIVSTKWPLIGGNFVVLIGIIWTIISFKSRQNFQGEK